MYALACSLSELGDLSPPVIMGSGSYNVGLASPAECRDMGVSINGVRLSESVIEELRKLGLPLSWYSRGELEDAVQSCAYDNHLIDDEDGITFRDKLSLTYEEKLAVDRSRKRKPKLFICADDDENDMPLQN